MRCSAVAFVLLLFAAATSAASDWRTYVNERFGATAEVPPGWTPGVPPANGDGLRFTSPDRRSHLVVYGSLQSHDSEESAIAFYARPRNGEAVSYRRRTGAGGRSVTVSGMKGDRIFYRKAMLVCGGTVWIGAEVEYPAAQKRAFDPLVARVARSLRAGEGWQTGRCR